MKTKYTVIYTVRWSSGSHCHAQTKMKRVELEFDETRDGTDISAIADIVGTDDIQYIFPGWPPLVGETEPVQQLPS